MVYLKVEPDCRCCQVAASEYSGTSRPRGCTDHEYGRYEHRGPTLAEKADCVVAVVGDTVALARERKSTATL